MSKLRLIAWVVLGLGTLIGCSTGRNQSKALVGGGAVAGQDYVNGLLPSEKSRAYFAQKANAKKKTVTIRRSEAKTNTTGVRFTDNGGVVIPPGASITFENQGYCCDPHLPAPKAGDEFQFVKTSQLIPEELQPIYRKLMLKASSGDQATLRHMQKLVWALRTAGTKDSHATGLTTEQKQILDSCSESSGQFERYCSGKLMMSQLWQSALSKVDSFAHFNFGGVSYKASDVLDDHAAEKKVKAHLDNLIKLGESLPVEHNGFNYGELSDGIYTDIKGTGSLKFKATVANSTSQDYTFYPMDYVAQVGSGVSDRSASLTFFATSSMTQKQRVTISPKDEAEAEEAEKPCDHKWRTLQNDTSSVMNEMPQSELERRKNLRLQNKDAIDAMREQIVRNIVDMRREKGREYGTVIYLDADGKTLKSLDITMGNLDWEVYKESIAFTSNKLIPLQRTTYRDGKFYVYDGNKLGKEVNSQFGDYDSFWKSFTETLGLVKLGAVPSSSWQVPSADAFPAGSTPLEIVHLHPDRGSFSEEDLMQSNGQGVAITVINERNADNAERMITYEPSDKSYKSSLNDLDKLSDEHSRAEERRRQKYTRKCIKCGLVM